MHIHIFIVDTLLNTNFLEVLNSIYVYMARNDASYLIGKKKKNLGIGVKYLEKEFYGYSLRHLH